VHHTPFAAESDGFTLRFTDMQLVPDAITFHNVPVHFITPSLPFHNVFLVSTGELGGKCGMLKMINFAHSLLVEATIFRLLTPVFSVLKMK
jgi:hypothetical protein